MNSQIQEFKNIAKKVSNQFTKSKEELLDVMVNAEKLYGETDEIIDDIAIIIDKLDTIIDKYEME